MKLAVIKGAQQILRDIGKPGCGEVPLEAFAKFLGVDLASMEGVVEGIRFELASREREADFVLTMDDTKLKVERQAAMRGVFRTEQGVKTAGLTIEERRKIAEQIFAEMPDELKKDELGKQKVVETLNVRSVIEVTAVVASAFYISCDRKSNVKFWPAIMQRMKDANDVEKWSRRLEEAAIKRAHAEQEILKIPTGVIREKIKSGEFLAKGILPSMAKRVLEEKRNATPSS